MARKSSKPKPNTVTLDEDKVRELHDFFRQTAMTLKIDAKAARDRAEDFRQDLKEHPGDYVAEGNMGQQLMLASGLEGDAARAQEMARLLTDAVSITITKKDA